MRISALGKAAALTALYIAVFVLLVVVQFPSAGPIGALAGGISFKGLPGGDGKGIRSAELGALGLKLSFSERHPLVLREGTKTETQVVPVSYETKEDGFLLMFDDGTKLTVRADGDGRASFSVSPTSPRTDSVTMRFDLVYGATLLAPGDDGALRLSFGGSTYKLTGVTSGANAHTLTLKASRGSLRPFVALRESSTKTEAPAQFIAQAPMDPAVWAREISDWRDKAWGALSGTGFNPTEATWSGVSGSSADFDETQFLAYMAEALRRDRSDAAAALALVVRSRYPDRTSWKSVPFAGRTAATMAGFEEALVAEVKSAEKQVQTRQPGLFYTEGVVPLLFDRSPYSLAREAMSLARTLDFSKADPTQAMALIVNYLDARTYLEEAENPFARAIELVDKTIAPAIRKAEGGFFLQTGPDGRCDALTGLQTGQALIRLAAAVDKPIYAGIGQSLVLGFLRLADKDGSIPASVTVSGGSLSRTEQRLSAASIYRIVGDSPYYPRAVSFFKQLGPGSWAWTCATSLRVDTSPEKTVITMDYPAGLSHYLTLYGVKPYVKIQLYGLDYNMDAGFENYNASGYFYKKAAGAMYLKMRHKAKTEDIRFFY